MSPRCSMRLLDSYNFMVGLALKRLSPPLFASSVHPSRSRFPALCFLFAAAAAAAAVPLLSTFRTSSALHKDQSIKNAMLHEINPLDAPARFLFTFVPRALYPFLLATSLTLGSSRCSSEQEHSANYRRFDVILKLLFSPFAQERNMSSALITLTIISDIRRRRGKSG